MAEFSMTSEWFAVQVKSKHEKSVTRLLEYKGLESLLPLYKTRRRWSDRTCEVQLPLFPGYVFCKLNADRRTTPVLATPGVFDFVRLGRDLAVVEVEEIAALQNLMLSGLPSEPWPHLEEGHEVEIEDGPLAGCKGRVVEIKKQPRLVLSVTLLCRAVLVELDRTWVRRVSSNTIRRACIDPEVFTGDRIHQYIEHLARRVAIFT
jgi:transcription antitermination factor NusG